MESSCVLLSLLLVTCQLADVTGQLTAGTGEYGTNNEARDIRTQDCFNRILQQEAIVQTIHDEVIALKEMSLGMRMDTNGYGCPWLNVPNAVATHIFWSYVNVSCLPGYHFNNGQSWFITQCQANNTWLPLPQSCNRVSCHSLEGFTNANLNTTDVSYGTKVNMSCAAGQQLVASISNWLVAECQADGTWSVKLSNCSSTISGSPTTAAHTIYASNHIYAMALLNDELFVSRHNAKLISVYNSVSLQLKREIAIPGLSSRVLGLAVCAANNYLYVSDEIMQRIHRVALSTNVVTGWNVPYSPYGLSVTRNGNLLVATYVSLKVLEYTSTGSLVREFTDTNHPWQAVERSDGTLMVTRRGPNHGVVQMTRDGSRVISSFGSGTTHMTHPTYMVEDSWGNIYVPEYPNNRVQMLDISLKNARVLSFPAGITLNGPHDLCYDESRGRLFVGELHGAFRVLVFDNVTK